MVMKDQDGNQLDVGDLVTSKGFPNSSPKKIGALKVEDGHNKVRIDCWPFSFYGESHWVRADQFHTTNWVKT